MGLTDLSGRDLPTRTERAGLSHIIAVPPARDVAPTGSIEFLVSGFAQVPPGGGAVTLVDPNTPSGILSLATPDAYVGHIDYIIAEAPDIVVYAFPNYMFWALRFNGNPIGAFGLAAFYSGGPTATSLVFPCSIDIPPNNQVSILAANTDAAAHYIDIILHGWLWPRTFVEG